MNTLTESICKIGIFMIAAQAVVHFAPDKKYEKYMKLVVGFIVLIQFIPPIYKIVGEGEFDWVSGLSNIETELSEGGLNGISMNFDTMDSDKISESVIKNIEKEIKSKLDKTLEDENYSILKVSVDINASDGTYIQQENINNGSYDKYELNAIKVSVRSYSDYEKMDNDEMGIDTEGAEISGIVEEENDMNDAEMAENIIRVDKISIQEIYTNEEKDASDTFNQKSSYDKQKESVRLQEKFCSVLGVEQKYVEVSIYGTVE